MPDLSSLNPAERETLSLLAQGHTAKSIANLTGRTPGSVNERLREARRKTGVGSSRELARLLTAQESRDEQIGMAPAAALAASTPPEAGATFVAGRFKGVALMATLAIGAAALAFLFEPLSPQTAPQPQEDALLGGMLDQAGPPPPELYGQLRAETRDAGWAPEAEAALRLRYSRIPGIDQLRVTCGAKLCEVAGTIPSRPKPEIDATMQNLQGKALNDDVRNLGFSDMLVGGFTSRGESGAADQVAVFYSYWGRA